LKPITAAIRRGVSSSAFTAVVCGTSFKNKGVQPLLDAVVDYLPSPLDVPAIEGFKPGDESVELSRKPSEDEPLSILAFKIAADPHLGKLTFIRVYSGKLEAGSQVLNSTKGKKERIGKIFQMHSNKENPVEEAHAGHIYAVIVGSAINNDGDAKVGYTAPGVQGQERVIRSALAGAGIGPDEVDFVETHGTGTSLGDPIEYAALSHVYGKSSPCALGAVKANIGHLDAAAGIDGNDVELVLQFVVKNSAHYLAADTAVAVDGNFDTHGFSSSFGFGLWSEWWQL